MSRGGYRPGSGRPKGVRNNRTLARLAAIEAKGITPLEYMLRIIRDEEQDLATRLDAAKSAAPYIHAKLASIEMSAEVTSHSASELTRDELLAIASGSGTGDPEEGPGCGVIN